MTNLHRIGFSRHKNSNSPEEFQSITYKELLELTSSLPTNDTIAIPHSCFFGKEHVAGAIKKCPQPKTPNFNIAMMMDKEKSPIQEQTTSVDLAHQFKNQGNTEQHPYLFGKSEAKICLFNANQQKWQVQHPSHLQTHQKKPLNNQQDHFPTS